MQALELYRKYYQPETKKIDYSDSQFYTSLDTIISKYADGGTIGTFWNQIKSNYEFSVISSPSNSISFKQNILWVFARQLDSNINYVTDTSTKVTIAGSTQDLNLNFVSLSTSGMIASSKTTDFGIGMLSYSYAVMSLAWNYKDNISSSSTPVAADYACGGTESSSVLPICLNDMVENYLYDEGDVHTAVKAYVHHKSNTSTTKEDFFTYIRTLRGDKRFRLDSQYWGKY